MKRIKFLILFTICAMALLGGSYAVWWDSVSARDVVNTGYLNLKWAPAGADGTYSSDPGPNSITGLEEKSDGASGKNIGCLDITKLEADHESLPTLEANVNGIDPRFDGDKMTIALVNGYPYYSATLHTKIMNTGQIPVKLHFLNASDVPDWVHIVIYNGTTKLAEYYGHTFTEYSPALNDIVLDPSQSLPVDIFEEIKAPAGVVAGDNGVAVPASTKTTEVNRVFTLQVTGTQWNGYGYTLKNYIVDRLQRG